MSEQQKIVCHGYKGLYFYTITWPGFLNISCSYNVLQRLFACKWIYLNNVKAKTTNSFIFSQREDFQHCQSIFNPVAAFNINIISKDIISKVEFISEAYTVSLIAITQAPRPVITSVNATATTLNLTWNKGHWHSTKCQIRYKCSTTEQWTVDTLIVTDQEELEVSHLINGLQPFSQYSLTVACSGDYGLWSVWSEEFQRMTLEAKPTAAPYVSFYVEPSGNRSKRTQKLIVIWKALEIKEARGVILGYEVTYTPTKQPGLKRIIYTKDQKANLEVTAEDYDLNITAYNAAGHSPSTNLRVNAGVFQSLPKVKGLWASSEVSSLRIRWEPTAVNVSEFAIEWFSFDDVASKQWKRLNGSTFSTVLKGQIKPLKIYSIAVYSLYGTLCAPPETIQASLDYGTHLDIVQLQPVKVTKTSVTVQWLWQEQSPITNVLQYRLVLSGAHETSLLFPHQWQHTFHNLQANVKYVVTIYGETTSGNFSRANTEFTTPHLETDEIINAAVPIVLLILAFSIFSVLSRTVFKDYFFPNIANPGQSHIGHWLLNPPYEREAVINVLKFEDRLTETSLIHIEPRTSLDTECFDEDMTMSKMSLPDNVPMENSDNFENSMTLPGFSEYIVLPLLHDHFGYVENCEIQNWAKE
ncbi:interleukin-6 receptor subunit beta isoform X3 [Tachysurus vachellii]|uniref:interleukin-6 receptor subunit beta isoform X3 n=1 Tax=Tachysurus vachellii TaxID=175792 RepID=UPI00296B4F06|nr:interleukin-6 receptor subunit beta isoform X3 [Tachysurus vachellii]XP_060737383.1 interleukin-6 receptor subunit beta isoform X3 [Tachysurus vachellii]